MVHKACFSQMLITKQSSFVFLSSHGDRNGTVPVRMALSQGADIGWRSACCHVSAAVIRREQGRASQKCNISGERGCVRGGLWQREMWCLPVWLTCLIVTCFPVPFPSLPSAFEFPLARITSRASTDWLNLKRTCFGLFPHPSPLPLFLPFLLPLLELSSICDPFSGHKYHTYMLPI